MLVQYLVQLREPIILEDYWPIPIMGGRIQAVAKDNKVTGFEVTFRNQYKTFALEGVKREDVNISNCWTSQATIAVKIQLKMRSYLQIISHRILMMNRSKLLGKIKEKKLVKNQGFKLEEEGWHPGIAIYLLGPMAAKNGLVLS